MSRQRLFLVIGAVFLLLAISLAWPSPALQASGKAPDPQPEGSHSKSDHALQRGDPSPIRALGHHFTLDGFSLGDSAQATCLGISSATEPDVQEFSLDSPSQRAPPLHRS